ncbi:hypothetical protein F5146DRAFT_2743 [Armillaria mellea]|nr:hypothetical protein F5146DRAFT_2743 [Armillaria mellea]
MSCLILCLVLCLIVNPYSKGWLDLSESCYLQASCRIEYMHLSGRMNLLIGARISRGIHNPPSELVLPLKDCSPNNLYCAMDSDKYQNTHESGKASPGTQD